MPTPEEAIATTPNVALQRGTRVLTEDQLDNLIAAGHVDFLTGRLTCTTTELRSRMAPLPGMFWFNDGATADPILGTTGADPGQPGAADLLRKATSEAWLRAHDLVGRDVERDDESIEQVQTRIDAFPTQVWLRGLIRPGETTLTRINGRLVLPTQAGDTWIATDLPETKVGDVLQIGRDKRRPAELVLVTWATSLPAESDVPRHDIRVERGWGGSTASAWRKGQRVAIIAHANIR